MAGLFDFCTIRMQHVRLGIGAAEQDVVFDWFVWESEFVQGMAHKSRSIPYLVFFSFEKCFELLPFRSCLRPSELCLVFYLLLLMLIHVVLLFV